MRVGSLALFALVLLLPDRAAAIRPFITDEWVTAGLRLVTDALK